MDDKNAGCLPFIKSVRVLATFVDENGEEDERELANWQNVGDQQLSLSWERDVLPVYRGDQPEGGAIGFKDCGTSIKVSKRYPAVFI